MKKKQKTKSDDDFLINIDLMLVRAYENILKNSLFVVRRNQDRYLRVKVGNVVNKFYKAIIAGQ